MLYIKSNKISWAVRLCFLSMFLAPALSQADTAIILATSDTGSVASRQAADQKAALAKKAVEREAKKAAEAKTPVEIKDANEAVKPVDEHKGK